MPFQFRCPSCQTAREVSRKVIGRRVRCPNCNYVSRVEENGDVSDIENFDPYYHWLAIPPSEQPPNYYRLLGVAPFEPDPDVISMSADRQMVHVKAQSTGRFAQISQKLLNELAKARACLLDADKRQAYDAQLREEQTARTKRRQPERTPGAGANGGSVGTKPERRTSAPAPQRKPQSKSATGATPLSAQAAAAGTATLEPELTPLESATSVRSKAAWRGTQPQQRPRPTPQPIPEQEPAVSFGGEKEDLEAEMDMTPMVDVTFLLLIFFMVTAAFALQKTIPLPVPKPDDPSTTPIEVVDEDPSYVQILVDPYNTFYVTTVDWEKECPSEHEMLVALRRARQGGVDGKKPTKLLVNAHADALYEKVIAAMDAGTEVEFSEINVAMTEEELD